MNQIIILFGFSVFGFVLTWLFFQRRIKEIETDMEGAYSSLAGMSRAIAKQEKAFDEFKERFDSVMNEAEKQVELEAQWNLGLNNILNYSLADSFKAGGDKR